MSKKEKKLNSDYNETVELNIPDSEVWDYQIPGLAPPHINKPYKHYNLKKVILAVVVVIAVSLSVYFSIRTVNKETFVYSEISAGDYSFDSFTNTGYITELTIDYALSVEYIPNEPDPETNFKLIKDETKKITSVREYALNCDEKVINIYIGADVEHIDPKAFYSCWNLECIYVDENNPNYCDIDGVLYNKDKTEIIQYPVNHDAYLCDKYGYKQYNDKDEWDEPVEGDKDYEGYRRDVLTYVLPSTVTKIGDLSMNYAYLADVYIPNKVTYIGTLAFFKATTLENVYNYDPTDIAADSDTDKTLFKKNAKNSLPEGLEYIGSDAFSYNQAMTYVYIPSSVTYIGHHAFWDTVYKEDGELKGVTEINVGHSKEEFKNVETGDQWKPQYDYLLFKKSVETNYLSERIK